MLWAGKVFGGETCSFDGPGVGDGVQVGWAYSGGLSSRRESQSSPPFPPASKGLQAPRPPRGHRV